MAVSLADEAYLAIRDEILRGQLGPGTPLSRRRLARQLDMSVLPVSDALKRLEEDGLVETRARAGTRVKVPTRTDVRELYSSARRSKRSRRACSRSGPPPCTAASCDASPGTSTRSSPGWPTAAKTMGFALRCTASTCSSTCGSRSTPTATLLKQMIERKHVLILNWIFDITARRTPLPAGFHTRLAEGLVSGDPEKADALMREHVRYGFAEISTHIGALAASEWRERRTTSVIKRISHARGLT